jgi:hypothetical protein
VPLTYVRSLGALALTWSILTWLWPGGWPSLEVFLVAASFYTLSAIWLLGGRHTPVGAALLLLACALQLWEQPDASNSPVVLLAWSSLVLLVTEDQPRERALLLRVTATCVYLFTGLAKVNPAFLAGDQMVFIATTRPQMHWSLGLLSGPVGVLLAWSTVATELWLAAGMWFRRTRVATAAIGVTLHLALLPVAAPNWSYGLGYLLVLNFGLVAMYPAFWVDLSNRGSCAADTEDRSHSLDAKN